MVAFVASAFKLVHCSCQVWSEFADGVDNLDMRVRMCCFALFIWVLYNKALFMLSTCWFISMHVQGLSM